MIVVVLREREGKSGGGKGFLLSDKSFTLSTSNFQTIFVIDATRVGDVRVSTDGIMQTVIQRWGTGGGNVPLIYSIQGTVIGRNDNAGPQGKGFAEDGEPMYTLDRVSGHGVAVIPIQDGREVEKNQNGTGIGNEGDPAYTLDRQQAPAVVKVVGTLQARDYKGLNHEGARDGKAIIQSSTVRRLTPMECERLQGFPDGWTDGQADSHRYKQMGNAVAVPVVQWIIDRIIK